MALIKINNVTKSYKNKQVLGPINLEITKGSAVAIFGANGAGKTTLCEIISNTKNPTAGSVSYEFDKKDIPYVIGINFQDQVYPNFISVKQLIKFYARIYHNRVSTEQFEAMVQKFSLTEIMNRKVNSLSGGQRQRVNLFLSLFHQPQIYIGDEISTGLDVKARIDVIDFLKELKAEKNVTLILVSHNLDEISALCERIIFLADGEIIDDSHVTDINKKYGDILNYYLKKTSEAEKKIKAAEKATEKATEPTENKTETVENKPKVAKTSTKTDKTKPKVAKKKGAK